MSDTSQVTSVMELLVKGGLIMIPILLLSLISIYLFIERYVYIRKAGKVNTTLASSLATEVKSGKREKALALSAADDSSLGRILESGLMLEGKSSTEVEAGMESTANLEIAMMEKDTGYLGIIAGVAPMLGFIGTISGVIKIFYNISLADNISIGIIAGGLYQKMICSGVGLIVGVIAYSAYHYLQMMIDRFSIKLQREVNVFMKVI
jgi:biopolymer transport protein ExbB